jgi:hypothetical protein
LLPLYLYWGGFYCWVFNSRFRLVVPDKKIQCAILRHNNLKFLWLYWCVWRHLYVWRNWFGWPHLYVWRYWNVWRQWDAITCINMSWKRVQQFLRSKPVHLNFRVGPKDILQASEFAQTWPERQSPPTHRRGRLRRHSKPRNILLQQLLSGSGEKNQHNS